MAARIDARDNQFSLNGRLAVVTGGYGVIGEALASGLAAGGARVAVLGRRREQAQQVVERITADGGQATIAIADVLDESQLRAARDDLVSRWGPVDILVNAAGGNVARARNDGRAIFEVPMEAFDEALRLNLHGTVLPSLVFGESMAERRSGSIVNISSMAAQRALTGLLGYSVAKAGVENLTRWMAVEFAHKYGDGVRVNAIAPGFFITTQNRTLLQNADGTPTDRARTIIDQTPMGRFGRPEELIGAVQWLCSDAAAFVTGAVIPVDGGFIVFSGV